jgi:hypothetical protein
VLVTFNCHALAFRRWVDGGKTTTQQFGSVDRECGRAADFLAAVVIIQQRLLRNVAFDPAHLEEALGGIVAEGTLACECFADDGGSVVILAAVIGAAFHLIHIILLCLLPL